jgi:D-amino-acid dehydrogenase
VKGDALRLHQTAGRWRVDTAERPINAEAAVVALGPWAPDLLVPLGVKLPLAVKRGYHRHFRARGNASLARPILDAENGYCIVPMEQGVRITTGAEFAPRDAAPTPVQFARVLQRASELVPLGRPVEAQPWIGAPVLCRLTSRDRPRGWAADAVSAFTSCGHAAAGHWAATGQQRKSN